MGYHQFPCQTCSFFEIIHVEPQFDYSLHKRSVNLRCGCDFALRKLIINISIIKSARNSLSLFPMMWKTIERTDFTLLCSSLRPPYHIEHRTKPREKSTNPALWRPKKKQKTKKPNILKACGFDKAGLAHIVYLMTLILFIEYIYR